MATAKKSKDVSKITSPSSIPQGVHALSALGKQTEKIAYDFFLSDDPEVGLFEKIDRQQGLKQLAEAFKDGWTDQNIADTVLYIAKAEAEQKSFDIKNLTRWIQSHKNDPDAVKDCMSVLPPEQFNI